VNIARGSRAARGIEKNTFTNHSFMALQNDVAIFLAVGRSYRLITLQAFRPKLTLYFRGN